MGTHPIFESDFDCLTESTKMYLSRFVRDATEDWNDKLWYPPKGQVGDTWLPSTTSTDEKLNLDNVNILFILFCIQTALPAFGIIASYCDRSEQTDNQKAKKAKKAKKAGSSSTNLMGLILGVFGICAILYDCRQLLMATVVCNFIVIIGAAIMLVLTVMRICAAMDGENMEPKKMLDA